MIQAEFGVIPSIVKKENREEYIKSLAASQEEGNPDSFIEFMLKHHIANLEKQSPNITNLLKMILLHCRYSGGYVSFRYSTNISGIY